jgi:hypothetical protein
VLYDPAETKKENEDYSFFNKNEDKNNDSKTEPNNFTLTMT